MSGEDDRLDDAARAAWLYYVAGNTQDEIARKLGVSRQSAQRLVSLAVREHLIKVRIDHPIGRCMELSRALADAHKLHFAEVTPSDPDAPNLLSGIAIAGAAEMERHLKSREPKIIALGTGRALRACVEHLPLAKSPQHQIVSLLGNVMSDGSATPYNVAVRMADRVGARHYPMPLPVLAETSEQLAALHALGPVRNTLDLCRKADITFVGIGNLGESAPMFVDGFITLPEMQAVQAAGAVGEITSWTYDAEGRLIQGLVNERVASAPLRRADGRTVVGVAIGETKAPAIRAAMRGRLINALITDEATAEMILADA